MKLTPLGAFTLFSFSFLFLSFAYPGVAEAKITCRSIGLTYNPRTGGCNYSRGSQPRYQGKGNKNCKDMKPGKARDVSGFGQANPRVPFMRDEIFAYVTKLKAVCKEIKLESTYRDCIANSSARGMQLSRHLCGGAADTSGCPDLTSKTTAKRICDASGLHFINEGSRRYPHCQIQGHCN